MAKQTGIIKLKGTIGDISFYKTTDGHLARAKGGVDASRIANDPAFQRTRENGSEFGRAGNGGKVLRNAIRVLLQNAKDKRVVSRLTGSVLKVIKTDTTNPRGERTITDGDISLLVGFDFNINAKLKSTVFMNLETSFDRSTGDGGLQIVSFKPTESIAAPSGTTHFKLSLCTSELDFVNETSNSEIESTGILPYDSASTASIDIATSADANSTLDVIQVVSIEFYQEVNGEMYSLKNGAHNAMAIQIAENA